MTIPLDDRGLLLGDGLFETLLAVNGVVDQLDAHLDRLAAGCAVLGLPQPDRPAATDAVMQAVSERSEPHLAVRLTLTAGSGGRGLDRPAPATPTLLASAAPSPKVEGAARLMIAATRRNADSASSRVKSLSYLDNILARREARAAGADEAVMLNGRGEVACATAANLFWIMGDQLHTPALECGVLAGIMRGRVLTLAHSLGIAAREVRSTADVLAQADAVFLTNSLIGVRRTIGLGAETGPHPMVERLSRALP